MSDARASLALLGMTIAAGAGPWHALTLETSDGPRLARYYPVAVPRAAVLWLDDRRRAATDGSDATDWADRLAARLQADGVASLRPIGSNPDRPSALVLESLVAARALRLEGAPRLLVVARGRAAPGAIEVERLFGETVGLALLAPPLELLREQAPAAYWIDRATLEGDPARAEADLAIWLDARLRDA